MEPNRTNLIIGANVAGKRKQRGLSQAALGASLTTPVSFQQIGKFEKGHNRLGADQLVDLARVLECDISELFTNIDGEQLVPDGVPATREDVKLMQNFHAIGSPKVQNAIRSMVAAVAGGAA